MSEETDPKTGEPSHRYVPWLLGGLTFVVYLASQSRDLIPGLSVHILNLVCGLEPLPVVTHRLYSESTRLFVSLIPGSAFLNLNVFSALFASLSVVLLYHIMLAAPLACSRTISHAEDRAREGRRLAALVATLLLAVSVPFWQTATRAGNYTFDLFLLLASFGLLLRFSRQGAHRGYALAAAFLFGLGMTEYATMIVVAPVFVVTTLVVVLRRGLLTGVFLSQLVGLALLGLLFYLAGPLAFSRIPDYGYGQYEGFGEMLLDVWRKQYRQVRSSMPRVGGLLILLSAYVPWLYILFMARPRRTLNIVTRFSIAMSLMLLTALGFAILIETRISPYQLMKGAPTLLPYVSVASWLGYLVGYWYVSARSANPFRWRHRPGLTRKFGTAVVVAGVLMPAVIGLANFLNHCRYTQEPLTAFARNVVISCEDRPLVFSYAPALDGLIRQLSWQNGKPREVISRARLKQDYYRNYLRHKFLRASGQGTGPATRDRLLEDIIAAQPEGAEACAFLRPDIALSLGYQFVPNGIVVFPERDLAARDAGELFDRTTALFDETFAPQIRRLQAQTNSISTAILREYSRCANDLGTVMRLLDADDRGRAAYERALSIFPANPSALLNVRSFHLQDAEAATEDPDRAAESTRAARQALDEAQRIAKDLGPVYSNPMVLASDYGYIYSESIHLWLAHQYRQMGLSQLDASTLEQARLMNPGSPAVGLSTATALLGQGETEQAAEGYARLAEQDPGNLAAHIGLAVVAREQGDPSKGISILEGRGRFADSPKAVSLLALLYAESGSPEKARGLLEQMGSPGADDAQSLGFLALAAYRLSDLEQAAVYAEQAMARSRRQPQLVRILVQQARDAGNYSSALQLLSSLKAIMPGDVSILEEIVSLNMWLTREDPARETAIELLDLDPENFTANLALAELAGLAAEHRAQEAYLRVAMKNKGTPLYPNILNHLAYCLLLQGRPDEALPYAREIVAAVPTNDKFQHTLAAILMALGQFEGAEQQILLASTLAPSDPNHALLHAEICEATGREEEARELLSGVLQSLQGKWRTRGKALLDKLG